MQDVWLIPADWDTILPPKVLVKWKRIREEFLKCSEVKINRWIRLNEQEQTIELHGLADVSEAAMAAAVYLKVRMNDQSFTSLVAAKTKFARHKRSRLSDWSSLQQFCSQN